MAKNGHWLVVVVVVVVIVVAVVVVVVVVVVVDLPLLTLALCGVVVAVFETLGDEDIGCVNS